MSPTLSLADPHFYNSHLAYLCKAQVLRFNPQFKTKLLYEAHVVNLNKSSFVTHELQLNKYPHALHVARDSTAYVGYYEERGFGRPAVCNSKLKYEEKPVEHSYHLPTVSHHNLPVHKLQYKIFKFSSSRTQFSLHLQF